MPSFHEDVDEDFFDQLEGEEPAGSSAALSDSLAGLSISSSQEKVDSLFEDPQVVNHLKDASVQEFDHQALTTSYHEPAVLTNSHKQVVANHNAQTQVVTSSYEQSSSVVTNSYDQSSGTTTTSYDQSTLVAGDHSVPKGHDEGLAGYHGNGYQVPVGYQQPSVPNGVYQAPGNQQGATTTQGYGTTPAWSQPQGGGVPVTATGFGTPDRPVSRGSAPGVPVAEGWPATTEEWNRPVSRGSVTSDRPVSRGSVADGWPASGSVAVQQKQQAARVSTPPASRGSTMQDQGYPTWNQQGYAQSAAVTTPGTDWNQQGYSQGTAVTTSGSGWNQQGYSQGTTGNQQGYGQDATVTEYPGWTYDPVTREYKPREYPGWYYDPQANEYKPIPQEVPQVPQVPQGNGYNQYHQQNPQVPQGNEYNQYQTLNPQVSQELNQPKVSHGNGFNQYQPQNPQTQVSHGNGFNQYQPQNLQAQVSHGNGFNQYHQPQNPKAQGNGFNQYHQQNQVHQYQPQYHQPAVNHAMVQTQYQQPAVNYKVIPPQTQQDALKSTAGRPPCTVIAMGFGGRFLTVKPKDPFSATEEPIRMYQLGQLVDFGFGRFSGPLTPSSSHQKEVLKWIDEKMTTSSEEPGCGDVASLNHLWGLLKIACQHYGNLRSNGKQDETGPEAALAKLLAPERDDGTWNFGNRCLMPMPSEQQLQATAMEVKNCLLAGKSKEALQCARDGQLWGAALLLAKQSSEKDYSDTLGEMARRQFQPGFPLQTLSLLYAGQQQQLLGENAGFNEQPTDAIEGMLEQWQENLAIMAANRTNGDEVVITRLGDWLWTYRSQVARAHICYLIANANFDPSRLCLIGADHSKYPRTYAHPEAIQRTEIYEFARVSGNSQFILMPFQPYKFIYASMLAEAGRINEALKYCQSVAKAWKSGHGGDTIIALEDRLRIHSQSGSPGSFVGRLFSIGKILSRSKENLNAADTSRPSSASGRSSNALMALSPGETAVDPNANSIRTVASAPNFSPAQKAARAPGALSSLVQKAIGFIKPAGKEAKLGVESTFYFDVAKNRWVDSANPSDAEESVMAPPPKAADFTKSVAAPAMFSTPAPMPPAGQSPQFSPGPFTPNPPNTSGAHSHSPATPERPHAASGGGVPLPPMPPSSHQHSARARANVRSRYVDTLIKSAAAAPAPVALVPRARPSAAPPARFFVPSAPEPTIPEETETSSAAATTPPEQMQFQNKAEGVSLPNGTHGSWMSAAAPQGPPQIGTFYPTQFQYSAAMTTTMAGSSQDEVPTVPPAPPLAAAHTSFSDDLQEVEL